MCSFLLKSPRPHTHALSLSLTPSLNLSGDPICDHKDLNIYWGMKTDRRASTTRLRGLDGKHVAQPYRIALKPHGNSMWFDFTSGYPTHTHTHTQRTDVGEIQQLSSLRFISFQINTRVTYLMTLVVIISLMAKIFCIIHSIYEDPKRM